MHRRFPLNLVEEVGVMNQPMATKVGGVLAEAGVNLRVTIRLEWYHNV